MTEDTQDINWVDLDDLAEGRSPGSTTEVIAAPTPTSSAQHRRTLVMVETAFLASTASLIWLINYYFPIGPLLRIFFPLPIALIYLRRGNRAAWMGTLVSFLLLSILMGPQWIARGFFVHASVITSVIGVTAVFTSIWCAKNVGEVGVVYAFLATWALSVLGNGAMFIYCEIRHRYKPSVS